MCEKAQKNPSTWEELYVERLRQARENGTGCGKCIYGCIQFSQDSAYVMCTCDLA